MKGLAGGALLELIAAWLPVGTEAEGVEAGLGAEGAAAAAGEAGTVTLGRGAGVEGEGADGGAVTATGRADA